jgi:hypothetical protein
LLSVPGEQPEPIVNVVGQHELSALRFASGRQRPFAAGTGRSRFRDNPPALIFRRIVAGVIRRIGVVVRFGLVKRRCRSG